MFEEGSLVDLSFVVGMPVFSREWVSPSCHLYLFAIHNSNQRV